MNGRPQDQQKRTGQTAGSGNADNIEKSITIHEKLNGNSIVALHRWQEKIWSPSRVYRS